ncbi:hypothetical protein HFK74_12960|uniref:hypothetical protein n=1 Tax=Pseudomonas sp. SbOxS1 TaxID=2723884 RepID=UPI0015D22AC2|nr:hypothetical protein [Pseudomonas sp. SbOxS1]NYU03608.1 hypothetical protein [Pseudomonas sp. SbOxS1]
MDAGNISAIISAAAVISGVILGNLSVAVKEYVVGRRTRKKDTVYLAILVVSHLDRLANDCLDVAEDDGTEYGQPAGSNGEQYVPTTAPPEFRPLDISVDWKLLPRDLLYPILRLPDQLDQLQSRLAGITKYECDYPDHTEYFWVRRREHADLGLQAIGLAQKLRKHSGLPIEEPKPSEWSREQGLRDVIKYIDDKREAYRRQALENPLDLSF